MIRSPSVCASLAVAEADEAEPHEPGRVDPRRPAPVAADPQPVVFAGREAGLGRGDRRRGDRQPEPPLVEQVVLDQPVADLRRQVRQRQRRERRPRERRRALRLRAVPAARTAPSPRRTSARRSSGSATAARAPAATARAARSSRPRSTPGRRRSRSRWRSYPNLRLRRTSSTNPSRSWARRPQIASNCGDASRPDSSGWTIQISPSPSRSRCAASQS